MLLAEIVGWTAVVVSTVVAAPQAYRMYANKHARDVSLATIVLLMVAQVMWFVYGKLVGDEILAFASIPAEVIVLIEGILYFRYREKE
jgi:uncharacterized protein with PQ loop repeat